MQNRRTLAILGYHQIGEPPDDWWSWFYIPETAFAEQLRYLRDSGWQVVDIAAFLRGLESPDTLPPKSALLTFDDGCRRFLDTALPTLRRFRYPAVHFVPTDYIGKYNSFDAGNEPDERIFNWSDLRSLGRWGVSVQSHSVSHKPFSELSPLQRQEELRRSKAVLEAGLKKFIEVFAYPQGDEGLDPKAAGQALRRAGYQAACLYGGGPIQLPVASCYRLARLAMGPDTNLEAELDQRPRGDSRS